MATASGALPSTTFVLLGASNLARAERAVAARLRRALAPAPVRILAACGPGRGYCVESGVLGVRYAPIPGCGVIEAAAARAAAGDRIVALVTDVGNDLMWGVPARRLTAALEEIIERLRALDAHVVVTAIPVRVAEDLSPARFALLRALYFPGSAVTRDEARRAVETIDAYLDACETSGVHVVRDLRAHLGADRIHFSLARGHRAWTRVSDALLAPLGGCAPPIGRLAFAAALAASLARLGFVDVLGRREPGAAGRF